MRAGVVVPLTVLGAYVWALMVLSLFLPAAMLLVSTLAQFPGLAARCRGGVIRAISRTLSGVCGQRYGRFLRAQALWTIWLGICVLTWSYILAGVVLAVPFSPITVISLPGIRPLIWANAPFLAPILTLTLVRDVMRQAIPGTLPGAPLANRRITAGSRWLPTAKSAIPSRLQWPPDLVHVLDRRARVAQIAVWKIYAKAPGAALGSALITFVYAENDPQWSRDITPGSSAYTASLAILAALALLTMFFISWELMMPSKIRLQVDILRCLAEAPVEALSLGMVDPIGSHRAILNRIAKRLRSHARRLEARLPNPPIALLVRGAAHGIDAFTSSAQSLEPQQEPLAQLHEVLRHTAAVMAGQRSPKTLSALAQLVAAFDSAGRPNPELVVPASGRLARAGSAIYLAVDRLSTFTKALFVLVMLGVFIALLIQGHTHLGMLPVWKP